MFVLLSNPHSRNDGLFFLLRYPSAHASSAINKQKLQKEEASKEISEERKRQRQRERGKGRGIIYYFNCFSLLLLLLLLLEMLGHIRRRPAGEHRLDLYLRQYAGAEVRGQLIDSVEDVRVRVRATAASGGRGSKRGPHKGLPPVLGYRIAKAYEGLAKTHRRRAQHGGLERGDR